MDKLQQALGEAKAQLAKTEAAKVKAQNDKKDIEQGGMRVKKEIADMENAIVRTQQDLANKDHGINIDHRVRISPQDTLNPNICKFILNTFLRN